MAQQADGTVYIDTLLDTTGFKAGGKDVEAAVRRMSKTVSGIGTTAKIALQKQTDAFVKANQAYAQQEQKVESLREKLKDLESQKAPTEEYKALGKELESLNAELDKIKAKQQEWLDLGFSESDVFSKTKKEYDAIVAKIDVVKTKQKEMQNAGTAFVQTDTSSATQKLFLEEQRLQQMNNSLSTSYASLKNKVESYSGSAVNLTAIKKRLDKAFSSFVSTVRKVAKSVGGALVSGLKKAGTAMFNLHKSTKKSDRSIGSSIKTMLKYGLGIRSVFLLVNKLRSALVDGFKNLVQYDNRTNASVSSLMSALTQLKNSFATAFAPILNVVAPILKTFINMISRAVTYVGMLIAALTGQNSFVRATEVQEDYAASLDDTADGYKKAEKSQSKYLSGLDEIRRLENPNDNNSDSGNGGGYTAPTPGEMFETVPVENSLKNLAEKIKEAWKNADFTELGNVIGDRLKDALDNIPWKNIKASAEKVGKSLATLLNGVVETSSLAKSIGKTVGELLNIGISGADAFITKLHFDSLGGFIADAMNKAIETVNFKAIGSLIADSLNGVFKAGSAWVGKFDFGALGRELVNGMNTAIGRISWTAIGRTIRNGLNGIFKLAETWSGKFDFKQLGIALRKLINSTLTGINWKSAITAASNIGRGIAQAMNEVITPRTFGNIGGAVAGAVRIVIAGVRNWVTAADFYNWGQSLGAALNNFFHGIDWIEAGLTLDGLIGGLVDFMKGLVDSKAFETFAEKIGTALSEVNWLGHLFKAGRAIAEALKDILVGAASTPAGRFIEAIGGFLLGVKLTSSLFKFVDDISTILGGDRNTRILKKTMESLLGGATEAAADTAAEKVKTFTDEIEKTGGAVQNTKEKTEKAKDEFGKFWGTALNFGASASLLDLLGHQKATINDLEKATNNYNNAFGPVLQALMDLKEQGFITNKQIANIIPSSEEINSDIFSFNSSFQKVIDYIEQAGISSEDFKNALSTALEESSGFSSEYSEEIQKYLGEVGNSFSSLEKSSEIEFPDIEKNVGDAFKNVESTSEEKWSNTYDSVLEAISGIDNDVKDIMTRVVTSMQLNWQSVVINTNQIWELIARKVNTELNNALKSARQITSDIIYAFSNMNSCMRNTFSDFVYEVQRSMGNMYDIGHNAAQSFANGIRSVHIPMPHISVSSSTWRTGNGYSYSMDSNVNWYKTGGLFEHPSVIGVGEAGREAVLPIESRPVMAKLANSIVSGLSAATLKKTPLMATGSIIPPRAEKISSSAELQHTVASLNNILDKLNIPNNKTGQQNSTIRIPIILDGRQIFEAIIDEAKMKQLVSGRNPFEMA